MNKFGLAFKEARLQSGKTFRQIAEAIEKSIGYVSDIEAGRKNPPEEETVAKIEKLFGIGDKKLQTFAREVRTVIPSNLSSLVRARPMLGDLLLRHEEITTEDVDELLKKLAKRSAEREAANRKGMLFLDGISVEYFGRDHTRI